MGIKHILVQHGYQAEDILKLLEAGADFCSLALKFSTCSSSRNCGDLGPLRPGRFVEEFEEACNLIEVGNWTRRPVKTRFGYHIIFKY